MGLKNKLPYFLHCVKKDTRKKKKETRVMFELMIAPNHWRDESNLKADFLTLGLSILFLNCVAPGLLGSSVD